MGVPCRGHQRELTCLFFQRHATDERIDARRQGVFALGTLHERTHGACLPGRKRTRTEHQRAPGYAETIHEGITKLVARNRWSIKVTTERRAIRARRRVLRQSLFDERLSWVLLPVNIRDQS